MRTGEVLRAQRAIGEAPDTRRMKAELAAGNRYLRRWLERQGCEVHGTTIARRSDATD